MKNIGIFIGYAPEQPIKNQGIGRLMNFIITGILECNDKKVVIACPSWYKETLEDFLKDHGILSDKIEILTSNKVPIVIRIRQFMRTCFKNKALKKNAHTSTSSANHRNSILLMTKSAIKLYTKIIFRWLSMSSSIAFLLVGLIISSISIIAIPFLFLLGLILSVVLWPKYKTKLNIAQRFPILTKLDFTKKFPTLAKIKIHAAKPLSQFKNNFFANFAYDEFRKTEFKKIISLINKRNDIPVWFVPSLFWPEVSRINVKKVIAAPDAVFLDFPSQFLDFTFERNYLKILHSLTVADHLICYSNYVKQMHLMEGFGIHSDKVSVIEHGAIELNHYLDCNEIHDKNSVIVRQTALQILRDYQSSALTHNEYLHNYDFANAKFMFYSSQIRPHKNFLNLIKAYEILLRKRGLNIKLFITADYSRHNEIREYIFNKHLQFDVISLPEIPSKVLAVLNYLAICAVNPTLFEGGFPFTFNEAYSVGTPSVMSNIPVVSQHINEKNLCDVMLFDPYNVHDMANKMEWAVKNHQKLYELQAPLYQQFKQRTWKIVATDYLSLLSQFAATKT